nr:unnamed protein product [Fasciola hepatica]
MWTCTTVVNGQSSSNTTANQSSSKFCVVVEPPTLWKRSNTRVLVPEAVHPSFVEPRQVNPAYVPDKMCSKTLRIMYREESVKLHDVFEQRLLIQVDPSKLEQSVLKHEVFLCVELWFAEEGSHNTFSVRSLEKVYERQLRVQLTPTRGLHHHFDVFFDYFHLCAVEMGLHGALTNVSPSIISLQKLSPHATPLPRSGSTQNLEQQSWHSILFNIRNHESHYAFHASRVQLARSIHRHLCHILLAARESMLMFWKELLPYLPVRFRPRIGTTNFAEKLEELSKQMHALSSDEEMANQLSLDVARLSSQNTALLKQMSKSIVLHYKVTAYLRRKTHQVRMKRFAESFFCQELSIVHLLEIYDPKGEITVGHEALANEVRQSPYFQQLPALSVSCRELDGDPNTLPIIFEDVFLSPNSIHSKRVPWCHQPGVIANASGVWYDPSYVPLARGDSQVSDKSHQSEPLSGDANRVRLDAQPSTRIRIETSSSHQKQAHLLRGLPSPLTDSSRAFSRSSPALAELGIARTNATLPPVLRYLSQNRRRFRNSNSHGHRSFQAIRSKHDMSALPDPMHDGPVRLLGYRSVGVISDAPIVDCKSKAVSIRVHHKHSCGCGVIETPTVRLRPKHLSLRTRDLRSRSVNSIHTRTASTSAFTDDHGLYSSLSEASLMHNSGYCNVKLSSSDASNDVDEPCLLIAEQLKSVCGGAHRKRHDSQSDRSGVTPSLNRTSNIQNSSFDERQLPSPVVRCSSFIAAPSHSVALGTLSRTPREPPGGCVPPAYLTNGLDLFTSQNCTNTTCTDSSMRPFLRSRTLSSLSVPNLAYACALARVKSESVLSSTSSTRGHERSKASTFQRRARHKLSGTMTRRSHSAMCRVYTSDLACLGSCSELDLIALEDAQSQRCIPKPGDSIYTDVHMESVHHRMAHSSLNLCQSDMSEPYPQSSVQDNLPLSHGRSTKNNIEDTQNRSTNSIRYWSRGQSGSFALPLNGASSTSSEEVMDFVTRKQVCGSNNLQSLHVTASASISDAAATDSITRRPPLMPNGFTKALTLTSCDRNSLLTETGTTRSLGTLRTAHRYEPNSQLRECGYQLHSDIDGDTDDEMDLPKRPGGYHTQSRQDEKFSILELLREDGQLHRWQTASQRVHNVSALPSGAAQTQSLKYRTIDSVPSLHNTLVSCRSCVTLPTEIVSKPLVDVISPGVVEFLQLKENVKRQISVDFQGHVYSDFATVAAPYAYFSDPPMQNDELHLVVCVHGLDGNASDLRLVRIYLQLALPDCRLEFLMSEGNQHDTFAGFDTMRDNLVDEIISFIEGLDEPPTRISFIAHSMGCVLVRAALCNPLLAPYLPRLHTFLSLSGPHLGTVYNSSGLVNMGMWVMQKWKKSESLSQLRLRDDTDLRNTYLYHLSASAGLDWFRYVLLVSSPQDRYVPYHSTRIELCKAAVRDSSTLGVVYMEMVTNILQRLIKSSRTTVVRYSWKSLSASHVPSTFDDHFPVMFFCQWIHVGGRV